MSAESSVKRSSDFASCGGCGRNQQFSVPSTFQFECFFYKYTTRVLIPHHSKHLANRLSLSPPSARDRRKCLQHHSPKTIPTKSSSTKWTFTTPRNPSATPAGNPARDETRIPNKSSPKPTVGKPLCWRPRITPAHRPLSLPRARPRMAQLHPSTPLGLRDPSIWHRRPRV